MKAATALRLELRILANRLGPHITLRQFCHEVGIAPSTVSRCCGSWTQLRVAAGLPARSPRGRLMGDLYRLRHRLLLRQIKTAAALLMMFGIGLATPAVFRDRAAAHIVGFRSAKALPFAERKATIRTNWTTPRDRPRP
ncbi:MAG TPA: hypothetical protein VM165_11735, partial [Planctomycetaceae bacterium]|nr:hypothetical protein [Planctomycetaceae bacterium]